MDRDHPPPDPRRVRVGVNGFGRIGRVFTRVATTYAVANVEVVAINDPGTTADAAAYLFNHDSVYGYHDDHSTYGVSGSGWQGAGNGETPGDLWSPAVGQRRGAGMSASASGGDAGLGTYSTPLGTLAMMGSFVH